jgi:hypothetical protein
MAIYDDDYEMDEKYGYIGLPDKLTKNEVIKIITIDYCMQSELEDFFKEMGISDSYDTEDVFSWMGY